MSLSKLTILAAFLLPLVTQVAFAEYPIFESRADCLQSAEEKHQTHMQYLQEEEMAEQQILLDATNDIRHYELQACMNTYL